MFKEDLGPLLIDVCWPFHAIIDMSGFSSPILLLASSPSFHFLPPSVSAFVLCVEEFECFLDFSLICWVLDYVPLYSLLGDHFRDYNKHINCSDYLELMFYHLR